MKTLLAISLAFAGSLLANIAPTAPTINEPELEGQIVNPEDVHLETSVFSDPDSGLDGTFAGSDYEIWTVTPSQRVWFSLGMTGVESFHNHLGDGSFENSHAGRTGLLFDADYTLRVRHRDQSGDPATEYSAWSVRNFTTGSAGQLFPILLTDIANAPAPAWTDSNGDPVVLPPAATQPKLELLTTEDFLLLRLEGFDAVTNQVTNPAPDDHDHAFKLRLTAGSDPLALPESTLQFEDNLSRPLTIYLPGLSLAAGANQVFWISVNGSSYFGTAGDSEPDFSNLARGSAVPWAALQPGYRVELVAGGFRLPVNIAFVPNPGSNPDDPLYYVTELYGSIKVIRNNGLISTYADNLVNYTPSGAFPGTGEQGLTGLVIDSNGDLYVNMLHSNPGTGNNPRVVKFTSTDGGLTASTQTTLLDMAPETQGQSHQISNLSIGPDDKLYVHNGDGFNAGTAQNLNQFRGKVLRMNKDGSAPTDNPFYDNSNGINSADYVYAYGVRNPFGGAWRTSDGGHYEVENGPSTDRLARITPGTNYGWTGSDSDMLINAIYAWAPATGPVNMTFVQNSVFGGSGFPSDKMDRAYVTLSGPTYGSGPQSRGKRIEEFEIDASGNLVSGPTTLVQYNGSGRATACGLTAGPDGLYFTDLYKDLDTSGPTEAGANVLRVVFTGIASFTADVTNGDPPLTVQFTDTSEVPNPVGWLWDFGDGGTSALQDPQHTFTAQGVYDVKLSVTGANGVVQTRQVAAVSVGIVPKTALFVVADGNNLNVAEQAIITQLNGLGYMVTPVSGDASQADDAAGMSLVLISSSLASGSVNTKFTNVAVPVINYEQALFDDLGMSLSGDHGTSAGQSQIDILDSAHPLAEGHSGAVTVYSSAGTMSWGGGNANALKIASLTGNPNQLAIFGYDAGAVMPGLVAPARRVGFFFEDIGGSLATDHGWHLFQRAVNWASNSAPVPSLDAPLGGQVFLTGSDILLEASVFDADANVAQVEFFVDGAPVGTATTPPYRYSWAGAAEGAHTLTATATDAAGDSGTSAAVNITVATPYGNWRASKFTPTDAADDLVSGPDADPDFDFVTNLFEYYLHTEPLDAGSTPSFSVSGVPEGADFFGYYSFTYSLAATDVTAIVACSNDLLAWLSGPAHVSEINAVDNGDGTRTMTYRNFVSDQNPLFFRLELMQN